ncbi:MAG TPA: hypothetical protein VK541_18525 [Pedobacter sp.]|uniref:hypothetical protein n=1 Tax=Pedobacter sp. TaxID=1411316 RepID=UPI002C59C372|nr:hypothetical protein [Pedobacter sp.]HMI04492.1 hypothetical protein [Pedobacter sp.]
MKTLKVITLLLITFITQRVMAQENARSKGSYFNITEFGYHMGTQRWKYSPQGGNFAQVLSLRTINGIFLTEKFSVGVGLALEGYKIPNAGFFHESAFQIFGDARYYLKNEKNTPFAYADFGHSIQINDNFLKGINMGAGVGYKFSLGGKTAFQTSLGYSQQNNKARFYNERYPTGTLKFGFLF